MSNYVDRHVFVGDVVLKNPENPESYIVRRVADVEGYEMVSTDANDEPFVLEKDECWILADNDKLKPKVYATCCFWKLHYYMH